MAITTVFNGATLIKPTSVSKVDIDTGGGFAVGPAGLIAVIGEADAGKPGSDEVDIRNNVFSADQISVIQGKYVGGPIVDSASFLFAPSADAAIPSGAQSVWFYKTNNSTQASLTLGSGYGTVKSTEYGAGANRMTFSVTSIPESAPTITSSVFDETTLVATDAFSVTLNGGNVATNTFTSPVVADNAALVAAVANAANWSGGLPADFTVTVGGADGASTLTITMNADANAHQNGFGRSMELAGATIAKFGLAAGQVVSGTEPSVTLRADNKRDDIQEEEALGGAVALTLGHDGTGGATTATVTVNATSILLIEDGATAHTINKASFPTLSSLIGEINLKAGWTATIADATLQALSPSSLDQVTSVGAFSAAGHQPARLKRDASAAADFFENSIGLTATGLLLKGLPDALSETSLSGGSRGVTTPASILAALEAFTKFHVNSVVPLFSRDAVDDAADGLTDPASTYTIAGIHQAVKTHLSLMKTTKKKSERQGYLSVKDTFVNSKTIAADLGDSRIQLFIQDIRQSDAAGNIRFFQPWALASMFAGARGGAPIGEPLTFKFLNVSGIRHTAQPMSTPEENVTLDFDPDLQGEEAILAGITTLERPQVGGFRVIVDNTTYGRDDNFVFNRANVQYAADIVAFNFRNQMENTFIGRKNTIAVNDVITAATAALGAFASQGIVVSTPDAPGGFKGLSARVEGNTIFIDVTVKIVEGIDFVLSRITIQRASQN